MIFGINDSVFWFSLFVVLLIVEAISMDLLTIWFACGALISFVATLLGCNHLAQVIVFLMVSLILFIFTRPVIKKYIIPKIQPTNADRVVGNIAEVIEEINNDKAQGAVKVFGQVWGARSKNNEIIEVSQIVKIYEIRGVKLIVEKRNIEENKEVKK